MTETTAAAEPAGLDPAQLALYRQTLTAPIDPAHAPLLAVASHLLAGYDTLAAAHAELTVRALRAENARDQLAARLDDLGDQAVERMADRLVEDMRLRSMEIRGGSFDMDITEAQEMTALFVGAARTMLGDAENYTETPIGFPKAHVDLTVKVAEEVEWYVLTVQRKGRLTPHEARKRAEKERDEALERVADLEAQLAEMTRCRDAAIRLAEREDTGIEFHLDDALRDGLAGIAEWEHAGEPDQAPDWLIDAVVRIVRPELARLTELAGATMNPDSERNTPC